MGRPIIRCQRCQDENIPCNGPTCNLCAENEWVCKLAKPKGSSKKAKPKNIKAVSPMNLDKRASFQKAKLRFIVKKSPRKKVLTNTKQILTNLPIKLMISENQLIPDPAPSELEEPIEKIIISNDPVGLITSLPPIEFPFIELPLTEFLVEKSLSDMDIYQQEKHFRGPYKLCNTLQYYNILSNMCKCRVCCISGFWLEQGYISNFYNK